MSELSPKPSSSRRDFLKHSSAAVVGTSLAATMVSPNVHAAGSDVIKVGLIGCGGRGSGAAANAMSAGKDVRLTALADTFKEQIDHSRKVLTKQFPEQMIVKEDQCFVGLDAYQQVIASDVDVVLLTTPPGFRPVHFRAAVEANKHVFAEKPVATDAAGVRSIIESAEAAKKKNLCIVAGFCWRYDNAKRALFEQVHSGAIGELRAAYGTYLTNPVKPMPPASTRPKGMSDFEWMVRNWYNFTALSGDGLVEQAVHTVDWLCWAFQDQTPESCTAVGGRQNPAEGGNIFDHVEVNYLWGNASRGFLAQRQIPNCHGENQLYLLGTKGVAQIRPNAVSVSGETNWRYKGPSNSMYDAEHVVLFQAIRDGKAISDGDRMSKSTLMGIMGRMAAYTGQEITWDMAMNSKEDLMPEITSGWDTVVKVPKMAIPGVTPFV